MLKNCGFDGGAKNYYSGAVASEFIAKRLSVIVTFYLLMYHCKSFDFILLRLSLFSYSSYIISIYGSADLTLPFLALQGAIMVDGNLDRERTQRYTLTIVAKDNPKQTSEQKSNQTRIEIVITDVNDNAPTFTQKVFHTSVKEDIKIDSSIITVSAVDHDEPGSNNSKVVYEVIAGNTRNFFKIDSQTGIIGSNMSLSDQVGNYTITIMATDRGDPQMNETATVNIQVADINQHNPVLQNLPSNGLVKTYEVSTLKDTSTLAREAVFPWNIFFCLPC